MAGAGQPTGLATGAVVVGSLAVVGAVAWIVALTLLVNVLNTASSCPHVYAFDGEAYALDGDMASGALFSGGERADLDRLEHLQPIDGVYRLRVQNDLDETDYINQVAVLVVDHDVDEEILPTQDGAIRSVRHATPPIDKSVEATGTQQTWVLEFARPAGDEGLLVIRGNNTAFAEEAFGRYMARMGRATGPLLDWITDDGCACNREYLDREVERLGLPLGVEVADADGWGERQLVGPVGPAVMRSQILVLKLHEVTGERVRVRLTFTPNFWAIDDIRLASASGDDPTTVVVTPTRATFEHEDVTEALTHADEHRVVVEKGSWIDVELQAPPLVAGRKRTTIVQLHGYYAVDFGGIWGLNPAAVIAHNTGLSSLPDYAQGLEVSSPISYRGR